MDRRFRRGLGLWLGCGGVYLLALAALTWAERANPASSIQSFGDAFWYSLVTMSTVGYGDLYPVTPAGRILGMGFVLLSVGLLTFVIGSMISILTGNMIPAVQLRLLGRREWFVFSSVNPTVEALAGDLASEYPGAVFLFPRGQAISLPGNVRVLGYPGTMADLLAGKKDRCSLFFLEPRAGDAYEQAVEALKLGYPVYCMTEYAPDRCPEGLTLFDRYDCCAREYWRSNGLDSRERNVVLIGEGKYARQLLLRGLMVNVFSRERRVRWHLFGDWRDFMRNHHLLHTSLAINGEQEGMDSLFIHNQQWNADSGMLSRADRIILCQDDERENLAVLKALRAWFPTGARIDLRCGSRIPGERIFGTDEQVCTAELVMRRELSRAARAMHRIYRDSTGSAVPDWEQLGEFLRQSNLAAADHLLTKIRILLEDDSISRITAEHCRAAYERYRMTREEKREEYRRIEHDRWVRFHSLYNWCYAPVRDNSARHHPLMLPFEMLDPKEQEKDDYAWELLGVLSGCLEECSGEQGK